MRAREQGFALPLAAVAIALLAVALAVAADALSGSGAMGRREEAQWRLALAATSLEARLAHLMLTTPAGPRALATRGAPLLLDGRAYRTRVSGAGAFAVSVQDEAGLFNLNTPDEAATARLLRASGAPGQQAENLAGALADFIDEDDLRRTHGAEVREYASAGRQSPANAVLKDAGDAWRALGWDALSVRQTRELLSLTAAADPERPFNPNTAPRAVLAATFALDPRGVQSLVDLRETRAIVSFADAAEAAGGAAAQSEIAVAGQPAREFRVTISPLERAPQESPVYVLQMHIADADSGAPIVVRRHSASARDWGRRAVDGRVEWLPDSPAVPAARER